MRRNWFKDIWLMNLMRKYSIIWTKRPILSITEWNLYDFWFFLFNFLFYSKYAFVISWFIFYVIYKIWDKCMKFKFVIKNPLLYYVLFFSLFSSFYHIRFHVFRHIPVLSILLHNSIAEFLRMLQCKIQILLLYKCQT